MIGNDLAALAPQQFDQIETETAGEGGEQNRAAGMSGDIIRQGDGIEATNHLGTGLGRHLLELSYRFGRSWRFIFLPVRFIHD
jgi:hypothetical protein